MGKGTNKNVNSISFLSQICTNPTIENIYGGHKNGLSKICLDVIGEKGMGGYFNGKNDCRVLE